MDLVNFKVGNKYIAFDILDILLTERFDNDLTDIPTKDDSFIGVKDFMGNPTPVFDLGIIMNNTSTQDSNIALLDLLREREQSHDNWLSALENTVKNDAPFTLSTDFRQSEFGRWYQSFKTDNEDLSAILDRFETPHSKLYASVKPILDCKSDGDLDGAMEIFNKESVTYCNQLKRLFAAAYEQVEQSYKPIIVFTTKDGSTPYIGLLVDSVEDSVDVNDSDIKPLTSLLATGFDLNEITKKMLKGMVKIGDSQSLIIDPMAIFKPELESA